MNPGVSADVVFRANTPFSRAMSAVYRSYRPCVAYLRRVLFPTVTELASSGSSPTEDSRIFYQGDKILSVTVRFLQTLFSSVPECPPLLRRVLCHVRAVVGARFPSRSCLAVGALFFLRFLVPALTSPVQYGITDEQPNAQARDALLQVSLIVQRIANGSQEMADSQKERVPGTTEFVSANVLTMLDFLERLCSVDSAGCIEDDEIVTNFDEQKDLELVLDCLSRSIDRVVERLSHNGHGAEECNAVREIVLHPGARLVMPRRDEGMLEEKSFLFESRSPPTPSVDSPSVRGSVASQGMTIALPSSGTGPALLNVMQSEVQKAAEHLGAKTAEFSLRMSERLKAEIHKRCQAEAENRQLRAQLESLQRRTVGGRAPNGTPSGTASQGGVVYECERAKHVVDLVTEVATDIEKLKVAMSISSNTQELVKMARTIRALHTGIQLPLGRTLPLPPRLAEAGQEQPGIERVAPLCLAAAKALEEVRLHLESLGAELLCQLRSYEVEQRLLDVRQILQTL